MKSLVPDIRIRAFDCGQWENAGINSVSLSHCHKEIHESGRRLVKGVNRRQERLRLLQWQEQVRDLAQVLKPSKSLPIPEDLKEIYLSSLQGIAFLRSRELLQNTQSASVPAFLPCIWAPPAKEGKAGTAGDWPVDVTGHAREVKRILNGLERLGREQGQKSSDHIFFEAFGLEDRSVEMNRIKAMLALRLKLFTDAQEQNWGLVEVVGGLKDPRLAQRKKGLDT